MTKKLYWETPYETKFMAEVKSIRENGIILDKTLFYPESGNQLSDRGYLSINNLRIEVMHVIKEGEDILHQLSPDLKKKIDIGDQVQGEIDWEYRYGIMKAHTSQHIFSAVIKNKYNIDTVHANLSFEDVFLKISQKIDYKQFKEILIEVNKICTSNNLKVNAKIFQHEEAEKMSEKIRSTIPRESQIRLMEIENIDLVCCGGTHVQNTAEIGHIFIYEFKKGNEIRYFVGNKAILAISNNNAVMINLSNELNTSIIKLKEKINNRLQFIDSLQEQYKELSFEFLKIISKSPISIINKISLFVIDFNIDLKMLNKMLDQFPLNSLIIVKMQTNKIRLLSLSESIDASKILDNLINKYGGKGGGNPKSAQVLLEKVPLNILADIESLIK